VDPLHDNLSDAEKEAEQLAALSKVIQQQQDTIAKQVSAGEVSRSTQGMVYARASVGSVGMVDVTVLTISPAWPTATLLRPLPSP
jgi:hypothetical protein